jgi:cytoskeletal protein CcmA (bactofilin family)
MHDQPLIATVIGPDVHIRGEVILGAAARIDGRVEGRIESAGELMVGPSGVCDCDIVGTYVIIEGVVQGDVSARERLELRSTGQICGEINAASISIAEGATFVGQCRIGPPPAAPAAEPAPKPQPAAAPQTHAQALTPKPAQRIAPAISHAAPAHANGQAAYSAPAPAPAITTRPLRAPTTAAAMPAMTSEERRQSELLRDPEMARILQS